ncbi:hypothetical protein ACFL0S_10455 [Thermodesulfobacteriota bacterium]
MERFLDTLGELEEYSREIRKLARRNGSRNHDVDEETRKIIRTRAEGCCVELCLALRSFKISLRTELRDADLGFQDDIWR